MQHAGAVGDIGPDIHIDDGLGQIGLINGKVSVHQNRAKGQRFARSWRAGPQDGAFGLRGKRYCEIKPRMGKNHVAPG